LRFLVVAALLIPLAAGAQIKREQLDEALEAARNGHVDSPDKSKLYRGAIEGALKSLDPYSTYLSLKDLERLRSRIKGRYSGIGVEIGIRDGLLTIIAPIRGGPAARAGILAGDVVVKIGDKSARGMTTRDSSDLLLGKPGTPVAVTVRTPDVAKSKRTLKLTREKIVIRPVEATLIEAGGRRIAHAQVSAFQRDTTVALATALEKLKPLDGVILDLRDNPGGLLSAAVGVTAMFLENGAIVSTVGRDGVPQSAYDAEGAHKGHEWLRSRELALAVLVNVGSASASEIVAGALSDRGRAVLVGEKTFGKGSVQSLITLSGGAALKLTTARYRLPAGRMIDGLGLEPDLTAKGDAALPLALDVIRSWRRLRGKRGSLLKARRTRWPRRM